MEELTLFRARHATKRCYFRNLDRCRFPSIEATLRVPRILKLAAVFREKLRHYYYYMQTCTAGHLLFHYLKCNFFEHTTAPAGTHINFVPSSFRVITVSNLETSTRCNDVHFAPVSLQFCIFAIASLHYARYSFN